MQFRYYFKWSINKWRRYFFHDMIETEITKQFGLNKTIINALTFSHSKHLKHRTNGLKDKFTFLKHCPRIFLTIDQYFSLHQKKDKIFFTLLSRFMKTTLINHMSNGITHRFWTYLTIPGSLTNRWHTLTVFVFVYAASKNI